MELSILKLKLFFKTSLIVLILTRILSTILMVVFISFDFHEIFISFSNFSLLHSFLTKGYMVTSRLEAIVWLLVMIVSVIGWPLCTVLIIAIKEKLWLPTVSTILMSVINIYCCVESIIIFDINSGIIKSVTELFPHKVINLTYSLVILLFSVIYIILHILEQKQIQRTELYIKNKKN